MKVIILSAGGGSRLRPLTESLPKCLLQVDGKEILKWQLDVLSYFKPEEVIIVTGYMHDKIKEFVRYNHENLNITLIENTEYKNTGNIYSLKLALDKISTNDNIIVINGDIIFHRDIIKLLFSTTYENCIATIRKICNDEDMKVVLDRQNKVSILNKEIESGNIISGQALGLYKISNIVRLKNSINNLNTQAFFNKAIENILKIVPFYLLDITNYPSIEIDTKDDLDEANEMFKWNIADWDQGIRHGSLLNTNNALNLLRDYQKVFNKYNIPFFLCFGLALGAYRDKKFISWDTDLDIGCYLEDRDKVLQAEEDLLKLGCYIPKYTNFYYDRWCIRDKEKIELHFFEKIWDKRIYDIYRCNFVYPSKMLEELIDIKFYDMTLKIPKQTDEYMRLSYGDTWRTPIKGSKTIQLHIIEKDIILLAGDFNPVTYREIEIIESLANRGNLIILVHTDRFLIEKGRFPIHKSQDERRELIRHIKNVTEVYIANDSDLVICEDLRKYNPKILVTTDFEYTNYEIEICDRLNIKYLTKETYKNYVEKK